MDMARKAALSVLMLVLVTVCEAEAQNGICKISNEGLMACMPAVRKGNPQTPTMECCQAIKGADFKCLCNLKSDPRVPHLGIDPHLALALPGKCGISTSPNCVMGVGW